MRIELDPRKTVAGIGRRWQAAVRKNLIRKYDFDGSKRMYFYHIRKTAGTSLIKSFMSRNGNDGDQIFYQLGRPSDRPLIVDDMIYVGWDKRLIEAGEYALAFSHYSFDELEIPKNTFRFTCFRDPVSRVVSHYRMLLDFSRQSVPHPCFATEGPWLGNSFDDFLERITRQHLQNQLFTFSQRYDIAEAVERINSLDHVVFVEDYVFGIRELGRKTGLPIEPRHDRRSQESTNISQYSREHLREMLDDEYVMLSHVQKKWARH